VVVEGYYTLSPVELDHHEGKKVSVVLGSWQVVVGLDVGIGHGVSPGEKVTDFLGSVVMDVSKGLNVRKPGDVVAVIGKPDSSVECDLVILTQKESTMSSMALESLVNMLSNALLRSYS
jgi:hypothetical protein